MKVVSIILYIIGVLAMLAGIAGVVMNFIDGFDFAKIIKPVGAFFIGRLIFLGGKELKEK